MAVRPRPLIREAAWARVAAFAGALHALSTAAPAQAAMITDVADAADTITIGEETREDLFDVYVGSDFEFTWNMGLITREAINADGFTIANCTVDNNRLCLPVRELRWNRAVQMMKVRAEIGIFHDLALTVALPIYFNNTISFSRAEDDAGNPIDERFSTIDGTASIDGEQIPRLFAHDFTRNRNGLGNLELGFRFAPLSDERDDSKPSWVIYGNWAMPYTAETYNPRADPPNADSSTDAGPMGTGVHYLTIGTALSRRIGNFGLIGIDSTADRRGYTDPYFDLSFVAPIPEGSEAAQTGEVEGQSPLVHNEVNNPFGTAPSFIGKVNAGFEIVPYESLRGGHKFAIDLSLTGAFFSEGRNYSELTEALRELTYTENYIQVGGRLGIIVEVASYVRFYAGFGLYFLSEHFITFENAGEDGNGDESVDPNEPADLSNPYYCSFSSNDNCSQAGQPSYDQVGYRFKSEEQLMMQLTTGLHVTF